MANPTGFITNKSPYSNQDLNTVFAPISTINNIDYGNMTMLGNPYVGEVWVPIDGITKTNPVLNNIQLISVSAGYTIGFKILTEGIYKIQIMLNFSIVNEQYQTVVFMLGRSNQLPNNDNVTNVIPSPNMSQIYSINVSGAYGTGSSVSNGLNTTTNNANILAVGNIPTTPITEQPYFMSFRAFKSSSGAAQCYPNIYTLDITFTASANQEIYPYIRCQSEASNPYVTMSNCKWMIIKLQ